MKIWGLNKSTADAYQIGNPDYFDNDDVYFSPDIPVGTDSYFAYENSAIYRDYVEGNIGDGDVDWKDDSGTSLQYLKFETNVDRDGYSTLTVTAYQDSNLTIQEAVATWDTTYISSLPTGTNQTTGTSFNIVSTGNISDYIDILSQTAPNVIEISQEIANSSGIKVGDLLVSTDTQTYDNPATENIQSRLTRVLEVRTIAAPSSPGVYRVSVKTERPVKLFPGTTSRVWKFKSIQEFVTAFQFTYLPGSDIKDASKPNGTDIRLNEILDVMENTNIGRTLADVDIITYRYIIDTFDGGVQPNSKYQLTKLSRS